MILLRKRIKIHTLKSKIILFFILFACMILIVQIGVFQQWIRSIIMEKSESYFQETLHQIGQRVDLQFHQFHTLALGIGNNQVVKNYLADLKSRSINYNIAKYKISYEVLRTSNLDWIENMIIYPIGGQPPINLFYTKPVFEADTEILRMLAQTPGLAPDGIKWTELASEPGQMSAFLPIQENILYGVLQMSLSESFFSFLSDVRLGKQGRVYLVKDGIVIYAKDRAHIGSNLPAFEQASNTMEQYELNESGWTLVGVVPQAEILQQIQKFNRIFILMLIVILAAVMSFAIVSVRLILRPLKKIVKGMESYWKAIMKGEEEIGSSIVALSNILRYSISHSNEFVTVREDTNQLESYLTIQSMRFQNKLRYSFQIQKDLWEDKIPKLVIQPLVENAIKYAFHGMKRVGSIAVRGYRSRDGDILFEVKDDGAGMPEEQAAHLQTACDREDSTEGKERGLGIRLVHQRAKYLYGEGYSITIASKLGVGTAIIVRLGAKTSVTTRKVSDYNA